HTPVTPRRPRVNGGSLRAPGRTAGSTCRTHSTKDTKSPTLSARAITPRCRRARRSVRRRGCRGDPRRALFALREPRIDVDVVDPPAAVLADGHELELDVLRPERSRAVREHRDRGRGCPVAGREERRHQLRPEE